MVQAYKKFWLNYVNFKGCSTRSDYWWYVLANFIIVSIISLIISFVPQLEFLNIAYSVVTLIPGIAIVVRRLHDSNKSGWNYLFIFILIVGWIVLLIYMCQPTRKENNKYIERV